ncbi:hypothetical protein ACP70R_003108 [Stipagrostis hirtigluma subsp. patula]
MAAAKSVLPVSTKTASRCTTEAEMATYTFEIVGYSLKKGIGVGKFIQSATFTVVGYDWSIRFYPDGLNESSKHCVAIVLELMSSDAEVRARYDLRVFTQAAPVQMGAPFQTISITRCSEGEPRLSGNGAESEIEVPPFDIMEHFGKLLEKNVGADVTFIVGGEAFAAHKIVLAARSPVFMAEFYGQMRESGTQRVIIEDMQAAVFSALLHFIYNDSLPNMSDLDVNDHGEMIPHLLVAADRYDLEKLKLICQSIIRKNLDVETVATTLAFADQHNCDRLKAACIEFIASSKKMDAVVATQGYDNLKRVCPSVFIDLFEKSSKLRKT